MKKTILTIVICLISSATFAQAKIEAGQNEREKLAGLELKKFANHHYLGTGLSTGGGVFMLAGYFMISDASNIRINSFQYSGEEGHRMRERADKMEVNGIIFAGVGKLLAVAGVVYKIEAPLHIKKAGLILSGNGVGIRFKIN